MRFLSVFIVLILLAWAATAQSFIDFKEARIIELEGVEFGYSVVNEQPKVVDGIEFSTCNIEWYITNKQRFSKVFLLEAYNKSTNIDIDFTKKICLGRLHISNAVSKDAGAKFSAIIEEPNMIIEVFRKNMIIRRKSKLEAFNLQPGETIVSNISVVLPKGQKPVVSLQAFLSTTY